MPSLLELQQALRVSLLDETDGAALAHIAAAGIAPAQRLNVYRNTIFGTLVRALRLSYPAVRRLVGEEFFDGAAQVFAHGHAPAGANLNDYGGDFAGFLQRFEPAASLVYLADVARLEWSVNQALHAADEPALVLSRLAALAAQEHAGLRFTAHPSISLLRCDYPADAIWRAVLERDDAAMAAIDLAAGPVHLLVLRTPGNEVAVRRLTQAAWRFTRALCAGRTLGEALAAASNATAAEWIAQHLAEGCFTAFTIATESRT